MLSVLLLILDHAVEVSFHVRDQQFGWITGLHTLQELAESGRRKAEDLGMALAVLSDDVHARRNIAQLAAMSPFIWSMWLVMTQL